MVTKKKPCMTRKSNERNIPEKSSVAAKVFRAVTTTLVSPTSFFLLRLRMMLPTTCSVVRNSEHQKRHSDMDHPNDDLFTSASGETARTVAAADKNSSTSQPTNQLAHQLADYVTSPLSSFPPPPRPNTTANNEPQLEEGQDEPGLEKEESESPSQALDIVTSAVCGVCQTNFFVDSSTIQSITRQADDDLSQPAGGLINDIALVLASGKAAAQTPVEECSTAAYHVPCATYTCEDCLDQRCDNGHHYCAVCGASMSVFYLAMMQDELENDADDEGEDEEEEEEEEDRSYTSSGEDESTASSSDDDDEEDEEEDDDDDFINDEDEEDNSNEDEDETFQQHGPIAMTSTSSSLSSTDIIDEPPEIQKVLRAVLVQSGVTSRKDQDKILAQLSNRMTSTSPPHSSSSKRRTRRAEDEMVVSAHYADGKTTAHPFPMDVIRGSGGKKRSHQDVIEEEEEGEGGNNEDDNTYNHRPQKTAHRVVVVDDDDSNDMDDDDEDEMKTKTKTKMLPAVKSAKSANSSGTRSSRNVNIDEAENIYVEGSKDIKASHRRSSSRSSSRRRN
jgi:hypothetical protein